MIIPSVVFSEEEIPLMEPLSIGSMIEVFAGLAAVLLLFGVIVLGLKRMGGFRTCQQGGKMHVVDGISLSARYRVLQIHVGENQVLIGVSPSGISPITVFDETVIGAQDLTPENGFAGQLQKQLKSRLNPEQKSSSESEKSKDQL